MCVTEHQWRREKRKEEGKKEEFWEGLGLFILERWVSPITPDHPRSARYDQKLKSTTKGIIELFSFHFWGNVYVRYRYTASAGFHGGPCKSRMSRYVWSWSSLHGTRTRHLKDGKELPVRGMDIGKYINRFISFKCPRGRIFLFVGEDPQTSFTVF